ncbi:MAG: undecaprenyldiphospho-muramoylpentapeptide beta-N-acetylglucosaminyltransferase [Chitinispirillaceae bacterium]
MKKILLTGGGTAGHVTPNLALLSALRRAGFEIHYVGTRNGIEHNLIGREHIPYHTISAGKLRRYFDLKNLSDFFRIGWGFLQSLGLMLKLRPSLVFSKGGFVSCTVVWAAWFCRIPVVIHESDITPGLANKLSAPFAKKICFSFPETSAHLPQNKRIQTGLPIRESLFSGSASKGKKLCGFEDEKPVILVMGGSQGSQAINGAVRAALEKLLCDFNICHLCGKGQTALGGRRGYCQFEYVNEELTDLLAMADIAVSRSGATTLFEFLALNKPNLLIPLGTGASRGDQILNARSFEKLGYSRVLLQDDLNTGTLIENIKILYKERHRHVDAMSRNDTRASKDKVLEVLKSSAR